MTCGRCHFHATFHNPPSIPTLFFCVPHESHCYLLIVSLHCSLDVYKPIGDVCLNKLSIFV